MNRIDIVHGGKPYSLVGRTIESIQDEIGAAISSGLPYWLRVNSGEGRIEDADLLIAPGIPFAVIGVKQNHGNGNGVQADPDGDDAFNHDVL